MVSAERLQKPSVATHRLLQSSKQALALSWLDTIFDIFSLVQHQLKFHKLGRTLPIGRWLYSPVGPFLINQPMKLPSSSTKGRIGAAKHSFPGFLSKDFQLEKNPLHTLHKNGLL